jgi:hypothetical protein
MRAALHELGGEAERFRDLDGRSPLNLAENDDRA